MAGLPYENTSSGEKAMADVQKLLRRFGCNQFGVMQDDEKKELIVQFKWRDKLVTIPASYGGYAAMWLEAHPYTNRKRISEAEHKAKALEIGSVAVYSILRDYIKGNVMAIETGIVSFEGAFLANIMLPDGNTFLQHAVNKKLLKLEKD